MNKNNGKQQLQLTPLAIGQELDVPSLVIAFEDCGGNLGTFLKRLPGSSEEKKVFLYRLMKELERPEHLELKQLWDKTLHLGEHVRHLLLKDKALTLLENWQNLSETSSTSVVAFAKPLIPWLTETKDRNEQEAKQNELTLDAQYEEVEKNMEHDDEANDSEDSHWAKQYGQPIDAGR